MRYRSEFIMKNVMDLHTHTVVSGHAYNTLREMARAAADKGLEVLGITEHGPSMPGSCQNFYFHNLKILPREMYGVRLLLGTEANIVNYDGKLDLSQRELESLDLVIASMHLPCVKAGTKEENTRAYLKVMENPYVDIIGHPDDGRFCTDYEELVRAAKEHHKIIELYNNSLNPQCYRSNTQENDLEILRYCKEFEVPIVVNSDAHFDEYIGVFQYAIPVLEKAEFPEELILNRSFDALQPYLRKK